jgi:hypothetical protein
MNLLIYFNISSISTLGIHSLMSNENWQKRIVERKIMMNKEEKRKNN